MSKILGLDFGTTNTCVSYYNDNEFHVILDECGNYTTPSCIYFEKDSSDILYGHLAMQKTNSRSGTLVQHFKRLLGVTYTEFVNDLDLQSFFKYLHIEKSVDSDHCCIIIQHNNTLQSFYPHDIVRLYLKWLLEYVLNTQTDIKRDVVITVPVKFDNNKRLLLKQIIQSIGFNVIKIINEPTAATLAYISKCDTTLENERVLVVDCGGGTTDFTILDADYNNMFFEIVTSEGDNFLGGEDITNNLVTYIVSKINCKITTRNIRQIKVACELCKQNLTHKTSDSIVLENLDEKDYVIPVSKNILESINNTWFTKFSKLLFYTCQNQDIDRIIFVGGTTRLPKIKSIIQQAFPNITINNYLNVYHTVSMGAAFHGFLLNNDNSTDTPDVTFIDTISMSIGIKTIGDIMTPIISKNSIIPCSRTETFVTTDDSETIEIHIYQGERRFAIDNLYIGTLCIQRSKPEQETIQITLDVNSDGILIVTARNMETNKEMSTTFQNYLTKMDNQYIYEDDIDKIYDMDLSNLILAKIELNNTIKTFKTIITKNLDRYKSSDQLYHLLQKSEDIVEKFRDYTTEDLIKAKNDLQSIFNQTHIF